MVSDFLLGARLSLITYPLSINKNKVHKYHTRTYVHIYINIQTDSKHKENHRLLSSISQFRSRLLTKIFTIRTHQQHFAEEYNSSIESD